MRNLLWTTNIIPHGESDSSSLCTKVLQLPGYLFLNDEEDGFRMTWVVIAGWNDKEDYVAPLPPPPKTSRHDIITKSDEVAWEEVFSKRYCGQLETPVGACQNSLEIAFEAYFRVDALLDDILSHRKDAFGYHTNSVPNFHYNLISLENGRTATMVIVFGRSFQSSSGLGSRRSSSVGVFLQFDIFTQAYKETGWVQHSALPDAPFLRKWSNVLAMNRRMKDQAVGPFCHGVERDSVVDRFDWSKFYNDTNNDYDDSQDADPQVWGNYLSRAKTTTIPKPPKCISCVSLFPDCELITNDAVRSAKPVPSIRSRNSTTEFVYG
jgi:hypothetical protein